MIKKCIGCGKEFTPWPGWEKNQTYCTIDCMELHSSEGIKKVCVMCGREFKARSSLQKTCCDVCRHALMRKYQKERYEKVKESDKGQPAVCVVCGAPFNRKGFRKTCCAECSKILIIRTKKERRRIEKEKPRHRHYIPKPVVLHEKKCIVCGKTFLTSKPKIKKTCSEECAMKRRTEMERERSKRKYHEQRTLQRPHR